jgi:hypothetical protein
MIGIGGAVSLARTAHGLWLALGCALTFVGCGPATSGTIRMSGADQGESWARVLGDHTRRHEPYQWVMRQADLRATLVTPRLRAAFLQHRGEFQGRFADEAHRDLVALGNADEGVDGAMKPGPDAEHQVIVVVAMYVADQKTPTPSGTPIWCAALRGRSRWRSRRFACRPR